MLKNIRLLFDTHLLVKMRLVSSSAVLVLKFRKSCVAHETFDQSCHVVEQVFQLCILIKRR